MGKYWILLFSLLLSACASGPKAELIIYSGQIYTGSGTVEALAVSGGRVQFAGDNADAIAYQGRNTTIIDLQGRFAMPGFNDAHAHIHNAGMKKLGVDLVAVESAAAMKQKIAEQLRQTPAGEWVFGRGWDENLWPDKTLPSRHELDAISVEHPIYMRRVDGHSALVNTMALDAAGYSCDQPPPPGGVIECDSDGQPTGWIKERASDQVNELIPSPSLQRRLWAYSEVVQELLANGVTSIQDDSVRTPGAGWDYVEAMQSLQNQGGLDVRVTTWLPFEAELSQLQAWRERRGSADPWLKLGLLKTNIDGSGGSLTAAMIEPYASAPDNRGVLIIPEDKLTRMIEERVAAGFQIGIHTIGDLANRVVLNAYQNVTANRPKGDLRLRVEHAQFIHDQDIQRFAELGVIASMQPSHLLSDMRWAPKVLGPQREAEGYRWNSLLQSGVVLALGTDYPVEPIDPFRGLYASVAREFEAGGPAGGWIPEEKITMKQAIDAYTHGAACAEFEDHRKGRLEPGKFADLVVLSQNPFTVSAPALLHTKVLMTMVDGKVKYQHADF